MCPTHLPWRSIQRKNRRAAGSELGALRGSPITRQILSVVILLSCIVPFAGGVVYYAHVGTLVRRAVKEEGSLVCDHIEHAFTSDYAVPIKRELQLLMGSPELDSYLTSPRSEKIFWQHGWLVHMSRV